MKAFDYNKPATKDEWVFAFDAAYRLWPEIGERYARKHALSAYDTMKELEPAKAADQWFKKGSKAHS